MKPITELDSKNITGVFFDIDETFSTEGKITKEAYSSLWNLKLSGKTVVPITGRPAGWCDHIARMWPVDAVVGENGAFYFMMKDGKLIKSYTANPEEMAHNKRRLDQIKKEILKNIPECAVASDYDYCEFDLPIDYCEDVEPLSASQVEKIVSIFEKYGASVKVSSIHVNGWFGTYDKLTTAKRFIRQELKMDPDEANARFVFVGDSPNDEPMFEYFQNSIGVANVLEFKDRLKNFPKYITSEKSGKGFSEIVDLLV